MVSEQSNDINIEQQSAEEDMQIILPLPFAVQLKNIIPVEITTRRFPVETTRQPDVQLKITDVLVDRERAKAQAILNVQADFPDEPRPYVISFKLVGLFTYPSEYSVKKVRTFLKEGSLSILLPFARELLLSLCSRLQVSPVVISLLAVAPSTEQKSENTSE